MLVTNVCIINYRLILNWFLRVKKKKKKLYTQSYRTLRNKIFYDKGWNEFPLTSARSSGLHCDWRESRKIRRQFRPLSLSSTAIVKRGLRYINKCTILGQRVTSVKQAQPDRYCFSIYHELTSFTFFSLPLSLSLSFLLFPRLALGIKIDLSGPVSRLSTTVKRHDRGVIKISKLETLYSRRRVQIKIMEHRVRVWILIDELRSMGNQLHRWRVQWVIEMKKKLLGVKKY